MCIKTSLYFRFPNVVQRLLARRRAMSFNSGPGLPPNHPAAASHLLQPSGGPASVALAGTAGQQAVPRGVHAFRAAARSVLSHPANRKFHQDQNEALKKKARHLLIFLFWSAV